MDRSGNLYETKDITSASTGRTVLRTSLRVAGQASVIAIRRLATENHGLFCNTVSRLVQDYLSLNRPIIPVSIR